MRMGKVEDWVLEHFEEVIDELETKYENTGLEKIKFDHERTGIEVLSFYRNGELSNFASDEGYDLRNSIGAVERKNMYDSIADELEYHAKMLDARDIHRMVELGREELEPYFNQEIRKEERKQEKEQKIGDRTLGYRF